EHGLEDHERLMRDGRRIDVGRCDAHVLQPEVVQAADDAPMVRAERHGIADDYPLHADQAHHDEALHDGAQDVLATGKASVKEAEAGGHQQDQSRCRQHPGSIAAIDLRHEYTPSPFLFETNLAAAPRLNVTDRLRKDYFRVNAEFPERSRS